MPAVVVMGARQTGKSTLVRELAPEPRRYLTFDDLDVRAAARRDPEVLVSGNRPITLDEVQRDPDILLAVKRAIDDNRRPGQFILTGSANLLLMSRISESLAGRASYLSLWPMTRREQLGLGRCGIWTELTAARDSEWRDVVLANETHAEDWRNLVTRGGFPSPSLELIDRSERDIWFDGYVKTYLERDLQDLSSIAALPDFRRVMRAACHRLGGMMNQTEISRDVALPQPTVHRYLNLLETSFMLVRLQAYASNRTKRLVKSPRLYWSDTGLALHLAQIQDPQGAHLENLILNDLLAWRDVQPKSADIFYWRTHTGEEVDFIIETGDMLIPVEIKSKQNPKLSDTAGIRSFRAEYADQARAGLLLHDGDLVEWIAPDVLAVPWWRVI